MLLSNRPWFVQGSIVFIDKILNKSMIMVEYGSGGSTAWYAQKVKHLVSIEHDKKWFDMVEEDLKHKNINNVDLRLIGLNKGYVNIIDDMGKFNFISIDGRKRSECIEHSYNHIHDKGYILLDDAERNRYYSAVEIYLTGWKRYDFRDKKLTSIFQKL